MKKAPYIVICILAVCLAIQSARISGQEDLTFSRECKCGASLRAAPYLPDDGYSFTCSRCGRLYAEAWLEPEVDYCFEGQIRYYTEDDLPGIQVYQNGEWNDIPDTSEFEVLDDSGEGSLDAWDVNEYFTPLGERLIREIVRDEVREMQAQGYRLDPNAANDGRIEFIEPEFCQCTGSRGFSFEGAVYAHLVIEFGGRWKMDYVPEDNTIVLEGLTLEDAFKCLFYYTSTQNTDPNEYLMSAKIEKIEKETQE